MVDPKDNLAPIIRELIGYGELSGIKINWGKSVLFPLMSGTRPFQTEYPLAWATGPTRYLGIWLSTDINEIWSENYGRAIDWIQGKILRWKTLPLSLMGRITLSKMVILPKLLYLFVNIPIPLTAHFFKVLRTLMTELVWAGIQSRIPWETLTLPQSQGGLAAPDFVLYAYSAQAQFLHHWIHPAPFQPHTRQSSTFTTKHCHFPKIQTTPGGD